MVCRRFSRLATVHSRQAKILAPQRGDRGSKATLVSSRVCKPTCRASRHKPREPPPRCKRCVRGGSGWGLVAQEDAIVNHRGEDAAEERANPIDAMIRPMMRG